ncbi:MAG: hypothetical protein MSIBF_01690 [Candidatus Altiarchaeales archaeon IMC4]|nr:MAG: hypothetical protein MSIBF_01690 [Candidatus Altiarchaeales archaeon IMC4]
MVAPDYLQVLVLAAVAIALIIVTIEVVARIVRPHAPNPNKYETYECGERTIGSTGVKIGVQYYLYALVFIIFDVEAVMLFPWAVSFKEFDGVLGLGTIIFAEVFMFVGILLIGLVYAWKRGVLEWQEM